MAVLLGGRATVARAALALALFVLAGCGTDPDAAPSSDPRAGASAAREDRGRDRPRESPEAAATPSLSVPIEEIEAIATRPPRRPMVLVISVDGLASYAFSDLGRERLPNLWGLLDAGASTLNARTAVEMTVTMPNHAGMMTGRRIDASDGGHGWTINGDNGDEIGEADRPVSSVFDVVERAGLESLLLTSKSKFAVYDRSWPSISDYVYVEDNARLVETGLELLDAQRPALTFLHLSAPDVAGHAFGWGTAGYDTSIELVDTLVGEVRSTIEDSPALRKRLTLVLTADHGGQGREHGSATDSRNFTIPFLVVGPGVPVGQDLYALNTDRLNPLNRRPSYDGAQPVRNADVANLVLSLLDLGAVPGSQVGQPEPLAVTGTP